jgi:hypothetical protein
VNEQQDTVTLADNGGWGPRILVAHCGDLVNAFVVETLAGYRSGHRAAIRAMLEHLGRP